MKRLALAVAASVLLVACNGGKNKPNIEIIDNMFDQISIKSQDWDPRQGDKVQMRMPPDGTIPRGFHPYRYPNDPEAAEKNLVNPLAGDTSSETAARGKKYFQIYCSVCHGHEGKGDGLVVSRMPVKPPPLISDKVKNYKDGRIFHIMTMGQGVMGSYASQITDPINRWAVVNYVRSLQRAASAGR